MRGIIGASDHCSKEKVVAHENNYAAKGPAHRGARQRKFAQIKRSDQGPCNSKNRPEAPTLKIEGFQITLARLAANPEIKYTTANVQWP